ncbi:MAG: carboxypeptidase-like regulatory domain-containing protein [Bacteroidota bacterium]
MQKSLLALKICALLLLSSWTTPTAFGQVDTLQGQVRDKETREVVMGATLHFSQNHHRVDSTRTDYRGQYTIALAPGTYEVEVGYVGCRPQTYTTVIAAGALTRQDFELDIWKDISLILVNVRYINIPIIDVGGHEGVNSTSVNRRSIEGGPHKRIDEIVRNTAAGLSRGH